MDEKRFLKKLGLKLRELRERRGWTLEKAEEQGWSNWRYLQQIEAGKNVTIITLRRAARIYRMPLEKILSDIE